MNVLEKFFGKWVVKYRWVLIAASLLVIFAGASGISNISFNSDDRVFFSDENPQLKALEALEKTYAKNQNVFFAIAPQDKNVFTRRTLGLIEELTEAGWKMPFSSRVDSISNFQHTRVEEDDLTVNNLYKNAAQLTEPEIKEIREIALHEPLLVNRMISRSGHVAGIDINIIVPDKDPDEIPQVAEYARKLQQAFIQKYPDIQIYLGGDVIWGNGFAEVSKDDISTLTPIMLLLLLFFIALTLRSVTGTINTLIVIIGSLFFAVGMAGWLEISFTTASINATTIVMTLAVADSIHILVTFLQQMRQGKNKKEAMEESLRINLQAVFLTSVTTAVGFLTMNFSDSPPFRDLGNIVAIGVITAFFLSVILLPALMVVLPVRVKSKNDTGEQSGFNWLADFVIRYKKKVLVVIFSAIILLSLGIFKIELHDDWIRNFDKKYDFRQASDFISENLTGNYSLEYSLESGEEGGINDPLYLSKVEDFANWFRQQNKVVYISTITDIIKRLNKNMHGDDPAYYTIPNNRELAAQYLLMYQMSLPFGLDLNNQINVSKSATRMYILLNNTTTREIRELDQKARVWLKQNAPKHMFTYGSGPSVLWAHISKRNIDSMLFGSFLALIIISLIMVFALRNIKVGLMSLIPNMLPALVAFGIWGLLKSQVGLALSVIASLTLGIIVDDSVHFLSKYLRARREMNLSPQEAVRYSFNTVGKAIFITTIVLIAGFLVMLFSGFQMNSDVGLMTAITIGVALVLDFLLLPALLLVLDKEKVKETEQGDIVMKQQVTNKKAYVLRVILPLAGLLMLMPGKTNAGITETKGYEISKESERRDDGFRDSTSVMKMTLMNKHGQKSVKQIRIKTLEVRGDGDKSLTIFDNPRDVKGTAFLNYTHKTGDDDQWLYLPALKRVKRISSRNKSGSFMGSEFSYEDISSREIEKYTYKWIRDEVMNGMECYVVESYPVDKENSGYTRMVSWIDKKEYRTHKVNYYDKKGSLLKTLTMDNYKKYLGKFWRAHRLFMVNHQSGKSTELLFLNYKFRIGLSSRHFNKNSLKRAR